MSSTLLDNKLSVQEILASSDSYIVSPFKDGYQKPTNVEYKNDDVKLDATTNLLDCKSKLEIKGEMLISAVINQNFNFIKKILTDSENLDFVNYRNSSNMSAINYATIYKNDEIYNILIEFGSIDDELQDEDYIKMLSHNGEQINSEFVTKEDIESLSVAEIKKFTSGDDVLTRDKPFKFGFKKGFLLNDEKKENKKINSGFLIGKRANVKVNLETKEEERFSTCIDELDRVLGGGIVKGSLVLVGGDPGIGKSTLLIQVSSNVANSGKKVLYISGEESESQIKMRAQRLGINSDNLYIFAENNLSLIEAQLDNIKPDLIILDSIQIGRAHV